MAKLTFLPEEFTVEGKRGDTILDVALENGISLPHECGGNCAVAGEAKTGRAVGIGCHGA